ncbi:tRNA-dihydrouridine synthase 2, partial [Pseudohyphozyma bogoriensis]
MFCTSTLDEIRVGDWILYLSHLSQKRAEDLDSDTDGTRVGQVFGVHEGALNAIKVRRYHRPTELHDDATDVEFESLEVFQGGFESIKSDAFVGRCFVMHTSDFNKSVPKTPLWTPGLTLYHSNRGWKSSRAVITKDKSKWIARVVDPHLWKDGGPPYPVVPNGRGAKVEADDGIDPALFSEDEVSPKSNSSRTMHSVPTEESIKLKSWILDTFIPSPKSATTTSIPQIIALYTKAFPHPRRCHQNLLATLVDTLQEDYEDVKLPDDVIDPRILSNFSPGVEDLPREPVTPQAAYEEYCLAARSAHSEDGVASRQDFNSAVKDVYPGVDVTFFEQTGYVFRALVRKHEWMRKTEFVYWLASNYERHNESCIKSSALWDDYVGSNLTNETWIDTNSFFWIMVNLRNDVRIEGFFEGEMKSFKGDEKVFGLRRKSAHGVGGLPIEEGGSVAFAVTAGAGGDIGGGEAVQVQGGGGAPKRGGEELVEKEDNVKKARLDSSAGSPESNSTVVPSRAASVNHFNQHSPPLRQRSVSAHPPPMHPPHVPAHSHSYPPPNPPAHPLNHPNGPTTPVYNPLATPYAPNSLAENVRQLLLHMAKVDPLRIGSYVAALRGLVEQEVTFECVEELGVEGLMRCGVKAGKTLPYEEGLHLAPMVRIGTLPMRLASLEYGATLVWGPEIVDKAIIGCTRSVDPRTGVITYTNSVGREIFTTHPSEKSRLIFQLGSSSPELAVQAAKVIMGDVSGVGLNCGCPKPFSTHGGMGAELLKDPERLCLILKALTSTIPLPIDAKIRLLPDIPLTNALVTQILETGISCLTVHCRYPAMRSREPALVERLKEIVVLARELQEGREMERRVPVLENGDCMVWKDAEGIREKTGVKGIMVARGAEANPSCFREAGVLDPTTVVIPLLIRIGHATNNNFQNLKYILNAIDLAVSPNSMTKAQRSEVKQKINKMKSYEDAFKVFGMDWAPTKKPTFASPSPAARPKDNVNDGLGPSPVALKIHGFEAPWDKDSFVTGLGETEKFYWLDFQISPLGSWTLSLHSGSTNDSPIALTVHKKASSAVLSIRMKNGWTSRFMKPKGQSLSKVRGFEAFDGVGTYLWSPDSWRLDRWTCVAPGGDVVATWERLTTETSNAGKLLVNAKYENETELILAACLALEVCNGPGTSGDRATAAREYFKKEKAARGKRVKKAAQRLMDQLERGTGGDKTQENRNKAIYSYVELKVLSTKLAALEDVDCFVGASKSSARGLVLQSSTYP